MCVCAFACAFARALRLCMCAICGACKREGAIEFFQLHIKSDRVCVCVHLLSTVRVRACDCIHCEHVRVSACFYFHLRDMCACMCAKCMRDVLSAGRVRNDSLI